MMATADSKLLEATALPLIKDKSHSLSLPVPPVTVRFDGINQADFDAKYHRIPRKTWKTTAKNIREKCSCSASCVGSLLRRRLPVIDLFMTYKFKEYIVGDIIAGISVAVLQVPQSMGYALLASLPPIIGLYTSFFPVLIYFIFGRCRNISMGTMPLMCLIVASAIDRTIPLFVEKNDLQDLQQSMLNSSLNINGTDNSMDVNNPIVRESISIAMSISFMSGVILIVLSIAQLGFLNWSSYISDAFMSGFICGASIQVLTHQIKLMMGLQIQTYSGPLSYFKLLRDMILNIKTTNIATLVISIIAVLMLILTKKFINERYASKLKIPVPIDIIVVVIATILSHFCYFEERFGVKIIKVVPQGLPYPAAPNATYMGEFVIDAFIIGILDFVMLFMMVRMFSQKYNYSYDANQEMFAAGLSSVFGSFFSSLAASTSPPRCILGDLAGGTTQIVQLISAILVLLTLLFLAPLLEPLPICILAALIFVSCIPLFQYYIACIGYWHTSKHDLAIWGVSVVSTLFIGVDMGIVIGLGFSMVVALFRTQRPYSTEMKAAVVDGHFLDSKKYNTEYIEDDAVKLMRFEAPLFFATMEIFKEDLFKIVPKPADILAMLEDSDEMTSSQPDQEGKPDTEPNGAVGMKDENVDEEEDKDDKDIDEHNTSLEPIVNNKRKQNDMSKIEKIPEEFIVPLKIIIIDCAAMGFVDTSGAKLLGQLHEEYERAGIVFAVAHVSETAHITMSKVKECRVLAMFHTFPTLFDALSATLIDHGEYEVQKIEKKEKKKGKCKV